MEVNNRTRSTLLDVFSTYHSNPYTTLGPVRDVNYAQNNVFNRFWQINLEGDKIECPVIFSNTVCCYLTSAATLSPQTPIHSVTMPIYVSGGGILRRTGDSIINLCLDSPRIIKVPTNKNETYYVGRGIIFNESFQILMLCTGSFLKGTRSGGTIYNDGDSKCYIHPSVFSEEDLLSKTILKKIVPFYLAERSHNCEVVIKDMTQNLIIPSVPDMNTFSQESINDFLKANIEEITTGVLITRFL